MTNVSNISLEEFRIGRRYKFGGLAGDLGLTSLYELSIPADPHFVDEWAGRTADGTAASANWTSIGPTDDKREKYSIGIIADVHQNTAVLKSVLQQFAQRDVLGLFCLGDYCFTSIPDATGQRGAQVRKVLELVCSWLDDNEERQAVMLLGNHELETRYYESEDTHDLVKQVISKESQHPRIYTPSDPFRSFEMDNAVDVTVYFGDSRRSFRLSHAITKEFVTSLYLGLDEEQLELSQDHIISSLGLSWLKLQNNNYPTVRANWEEFIRSPVGSDKRRKCSWDICSHIQSELKAPEIDKGVKSTLDPCCKLL